MSEDIKILENAEGEFGIIIVNQLPVISEQLDKLQEIIQERTQSALQYECTEDNYKQIKSMRSALTKERTELEKRYKEAMETAIAPIQAVQNKFKSCMSVYKDTDAQLKTKINSVENSIKDIKKQEVVEYFNEYVASKNIETQEDKEAILVEYKKSLNVSEAVQVVKARMQAIQEEKEREIERKRAEIQKEVASQKVDEQIEKPLTPPEVIKPVETEIKPQEEKIFAVQFKAYGTRQQLKQLKEFMKKEGIRYE